MPPAIIVCAASARDSAASACQASPAAAANVRAADIGEALRVRAQRQVDQPGRDAELGERIAHEARRLVLAVERGENAD